MRHDLRLDPFAAFIYSESIPISPSSGVVPARCVGLRGSRLDLLRRRFGLRGRDRGSAMGAGELRAFRSFTAHWEVKFAERKVFVSFLYKTDLLEIHPGFGPIMCQGAESSADFENWPVWVPGVATETVWHSPGDFQGRDFDGRDLAR